MSDYVAQFGLGCELRIDIAAVMTVVPWVQSINGPDESYDILDVTTHTSALGYREFITGLADGGEVSCTINWHDDEAAHTALQDALTNRELTAFQLFQVGYDTLNLADFDGYVTGLTRSSPTDAQITRDLTIKITGPVTVSTE